VHQAFDLALGQFGCRMGSARSNMFPSTHVQETFIELLTNFICREIHVLAVSQKLTKRLFLQGQNTSPG